MHVLVRVDPRLCMANQMCVKAAPELFELGPSGASRTKRADEADFTADDLPKLLRARDECPTGAITVETMEEDD